MALLVSGGVLAILLNALLGAKETWNLDEAPDRLRHLKRARDRLLRTLKDLENDYREGSLLDEDYKELRTHYKQQAIEVAKELSRVRETVVRRIADGPGKVLADDERHHLEDLIAKRKKKYVKS